MKLKEMEDMGPMKRDLETIIYRILNSDVAYFVGTLIQLACYAGMLFLFNQLLHEAMKR